MNINKYIMLKATLATKQTISISVIKNEFDVTGEEAEEMINNLIQEGLIEPFPFDGKSFSVKK